MKIETYFDEIQEFIQNCPVCRATLITTEKRSTHVGLLSAEITFIDDTTLMVREYLDVETSVDRLMYTYQYMNAANELIFRYDNTGHHRKLGLATYPHHKHDGSEENVISSYSTNLAVVLEEIEGIVVR